jgi:hypothetical protein
MGGDDSIAVVAQPPSGAGLCLCVRPVAGVTG